MKACHKKWMAAESWALFESHAILLYSLLTQVLVVNALLYIRFEYYHNMIVISNTTNLCRPMLIAIFLRLHSLLLGFQ